MMLFVPPIFMPLSGVSSTGYVRCGTGISESGTGTVAWTDPSLITSAPAFSSRALSGALSNGQNTEYLTGSNFGLSIPTGATILGIVAAVRIYRNGASSPETTVDQNVRLNIGGSKVGDNKARSEFQPPFVNVHPDEPNVLYGGAADLWGLSPTPAQLNASNFGVSFQYLRINATGTANNARVQVYSVWVNVFYA